MKYSKIYLKTYWKLFISHVFDFKYFRSYRYNMLLVYCKRSNLRVMKVNPQEDSE